MRLASARAAACLPLAMARTTRDAPEAISPAVRTGTPVCRTASQASSDAASQPEKPEASSSRSQGSCSPLSRRVTALTAPPVPQLRLSICVS